MKLDADNPLAVEIQQEMAAAYLAACRKMVDALDALRRFDESPSTGPGSESPACRSDLVADAAERVYFLLIQREAMQLSWDPAFFDRYDVPPEVRRRLGPKPAK